MNTPTDCRRLHRIGIAYMALAAITFPVKDSFLKAQDERVPALLAVAVYFAAQASFGQAGLFVTGHRARWNPFRGMTRLHLLRSLTITCSLATFLFSLRYVPLSTAITLFTLQGLFCIGFGRVILGEPILPRHILLVFIATVGVCLVARPSAGSGSIFINLLPLLSGAFGGLYIVVTRRLGMNQSPFQLVCQDGTVACLSVLIIYLAGMQMSGWPLPPVLLDWEVFLVPPVTAALIGMVSSLGMIRAAQLAPAVKLAPASYLEIASGALIGIFIFGEFLDWLTLSGIVIIVGVCLTNTLLNELEARDAATTGFPKM